MPNDKETLIKADILPLIKKHKLFSMEIDERHMKIINDVFIAGALTGIEYAKDSVKWRINGELWAKFIDQGITPEDLEDAAG